MSCYGDKVLCMDFTDDRLNMRYLLLMRNHKVTKDRHCVFFPTRAYENRMHLFFKCNSSARIWNYLEIDWTRAHDLQGAISAAKVDFCEALFQGGSNYRLQVYLEAKEWNDL